MRHAETRVQSCPTGSIARRPGWTGRRHNDQTDVHCREHLDLISESTLTPWQTQNHLDVLKLGVEAWNRWREENPEIRPDLTQADLREANLGLANLRGRTFAGPTSTERTSAERTSPGRTSSWRTSCRQTSARWTSEGRKVSLKGRSTKPGEARMQSCPMASSSRHTGSRIQRTEEDLLAAGGDC